MGQDAEIANADIQSYVSEILNRLIDEDDLFVVELSVRGHTGSHSIEAFLDSEQGATVEQLASIGRRLRRDPDMETRFGESYGLTVSSPGLDKPLVDRRQYVRHAGRLLNVRYSDGDAVRKVKGVLKEVGDDGIVVEKGNGEVSSISFADIKKATVGLPW